MALKFPWNTFHAVEIINKPVFIPFAEEVKRHCTYCCTPEPVACQPYCAGQLRQQ